MISSVISDFFYNSLSSTLRVIFTSGLIYDYRDVPAKVYHEMKDTTSKGRFLNKYIKGHYNFKKIESPVNG